MREGEGIGRKGWIWRNCNGSVTAEAVRGFGRWERALNGGQWRPLGAGKLCRGTDRASIARKNEKERRSKGKRKKGRPTSTVGEIDELKGERVERDRKAPKEQTRKMLACPWMPAMCSVHALFAGGRVRNMY